VTRSDLHRILEKATGASLHAAANSLRAGFVSFQGLRIGVCGEAVYRDGQMSGLRNLSSLAIRIPHAYAADCGGVIKRLLQPQPQSVLICAPPGVGKTSLLRALIRRAAELSFRVGVIDERNDLSASLSGAAQFELGQGSDVLVGVRKAQAAMMLLRGMNPQIIAADEITQREDLAAVQEIVGCGVGLLATAHAASIEDLGRRPLYRELLSAGCFQAAIVIALHGDRREYSWRGLTA
jgi:stage III sporulation protein AA